MPEHNLDDVMQVRETQPEPIANHPIDHHQIERIADGAVEDLWQAPACRGESFLAFDASDEPFALCIRYAAGLAQFPTEDDYLNTIRQARDGESQDDDAGGQPNELTESVFGRFGCAYVAATKRDFPVIAVQKSPPSIDVVGDIALRRAQEHFDSEDVSFHRFYFLGPHLEYLSFRHGEGEVLISACDLQPSAREEILTPGAVPIHPPEITRRIDAAWAAALGLEAIPHDEIALTHTKTEINHKALVPKINYSYWCVPTSFAMALAFWDNFEKNKTIAGYGLIVDHWLKHPNKPAKKQFGENVPNIIDEYMDPSSGGWRGGASFTDLLKTASGVTFKQLEHFSKASNNYGWDPLKAEIDKGRPCMWSIKGAHTMTAVGYETKNGQKYVLVYNPPNTSTPTYEASYEIDQWHGAANTNTFVTSIYPTDPGKPDHLVLVGPNGGESLTVSAATQVRWYIWGSGITRAKLLLSTDHGRTWKALAHDIKTKTGWNTFDWTPTTASTSARLKIEGYDATKTLIAADGSYEDFAISEDTLNKWLGWRDLGNPVRDQGDPSAGTQSIAADENADGRIEVFASTTAGSVWHRYQKSANSDDWIGWAVMGHPPTVSLYLVEAAANADGRLEVFAVGSDGAVWHSWQSKPSAGPWSGWASLGAPSGASLLRVRACANKDGRVEVFALGSDGAIWHVWQDKPSAGPWSSWASLGRPSGVYLRTFDVQLSKTGNIEVCASGAGPGEGEFQITGSAVWHARQPEPNHRSAWQGWTSLGSPCGPGAHLNVELGRKKDGLLELFVSGQGRLWRRGHSAPSGLAWTNWGGLGSPASDTALLATIAADSNGDGRQEVFVIAARGIGPGTVFRAWHRWQTAPNAGWATWAGLSAPSNRSLETICSGSHADGRLVLFAVASEDRSVWVISQKT